MPGYLKQPFFHPI